MGVNVSPQARDTIQKAISELLIGQSPRVFGLRLPKIVGSRSPELPELTVRAHTADFILELENGDEVDLEFQSEKADLDRFLLYAVQLYRRDRRRVHTVVVYTGAVGSAPSVLAFGSVTFRVTNVYLGRFDGDAILRTIAERVRTGSDLRDSDQMRLALSPLMRHRVRSAAEAAHEAVGLAKAIRDKDRRELCIGAIAGLSAQVLDMEHFKALLREVAEMTKAAEVLREMGRAEGKIEGKAEGKAEGKIEGKAEGKAEVVLNLLRVVHGTIPDTLVRRIQGERDIATLDGWAVLAHQAQSVEAFVRGMGSASSK